MLPPDPKKLQPQKTGDTTPDHEVIHTSRTASDHEMMIPATPPAALSAAPSLTSLMHGFRRGWRMIVPIAFLLAFLAAGLAWFLVPPQYTSAVVFKVNARTEPAFLADDPNFANVQKNQIAILKSHDVLSEALEKSRIAEQFGVNLSPQYLQKKLNAQFNDGPQLLQVMLSGENPDALAAFLNALGEVYRNKVNKTEEAQLESRIAQLRRRVEIDPANKGGRNVNLAEQLQEMRFALARLEKKKGLDGEKVIAGKRAEAEAMKLASEKALQDTRVTLGKLQADLAAKEGRIGRQDKPDVGDTEAEEKLSNKPAYMSLLTSMSDVQHKIDHIFRVAKPDAAKKLAAKHYEQLKVLEASRKRMVNQQRLQMEMNAEATGNKKLRDDITDAADKIEQMKKQLAVLESDVQKWAREVQEHSGAGPKAPPDVLALRDQVAQLEQERADLGKEIARMESMRPLPPRILTSAEAFVPSEKEYGRPLKFAVAGGVLMFGMVVIGLCLLEAQGRRVNASEDVMQGLGMPVVGTLPLLPAAARAKSAPAQTLGGLDSQYGLTEAVDAIRTVLLHSPRIDGARVVMVTSATTGEGKTSLASHLAASLARAWRKTLLIDGDLRNPVQNIQFEQPLEPGLCEALRGEVEFEDAIKPTLTSRLWLMPAGKVDAHALQALAQDGVDMVFERLKEQYDFIVMDTSPVLPVPDALLLGKHADAVLLSVMKDVSRIPAVYQAHQKLEALGIRVLGAVVIGEKTETYGRAVPYPRGK